MKIKRGISVPSLRRHLKSMRNYNKYFAPDGVARGRLHHLRMKNTSRMSERYRMAIIVKTMMKLETLRRRTQNEQV